MESYQHARVYRWNVRSIVEVCTLEGVHNRSTSLRYNCNKYYPFNAMQAASSTFYLAN